MKHIHQQDRSGCGLACVAMLANCSYNEVKSTYLAMPKGTRHSLLSTGSASGLPFGIMVDLLHKYKLPVVRIVNAPCIVSVEGSLRGGVRHFIVVDSRGNILDPAQKETDDE